MRKRNNDPLILDCSLGEEITVQVQQSVGVLPTVNYSLDGNSTNPGPRPKGTPIKFALNKKTKLGVQINFAATSGGSFEMKAAGSGGGDISSYSDDQAAGEAFCQFIYTFNVA